MLVLVALVAVTGAATNVVDDAVGTVVLVELFDVLEVTVEEVKRVEDLEGPTVDMELVVGTVVDVEVLVELVAGTVVLVVVDLLVVEEIVV